MEPMLHSASDLLREGFIEENQVAAYEKLLAQYRFRLPRYYASLIDKADPQCPIRLQAIPRLDELAPKTDGWTGDPLRDLQHRPAPRITHRYPNRVLLHMTASCSMYCRYCFRKTLLNEQSGDFLDGEWKEAISYIESRTQIEEVIFSGGDPLMVSDAQLAMVLGNLRSIPHLRRIRFHSRVPVTFPMRVTDELAEVLASSDLPTILVTHFNHPKELTNESEDACLKLQDQGILLLNQSVLLKGVNDKVETLVDLSQRLFEWEILPYYLHHPDRAMGTESFDVSREKGLAIEEDLRRRLPGYLVPRYVIDLVDGDYKKPVRDTDPSASPQAGSCGTSSAG